MDYFMKSIDIGVETESLFSELTQDTNSLQFLYTESEENNESKIKSTLLRLKNIITKIIDIVKKTYATFRENVKNRIEKHDVKKKVELIKKNASKMPNVEMVDVWKLNSLFNKTLRETEKIYNSWLSIIKKRKPEYSDGAKLTKKLDEINSRYQRQYREITSKKISVPSAKALAFVEEALDENYQSEPYKNFIELMNKYNDVLDDMVKRTYDYADKHDMIVIPEGFNDKLHNTLSYIKQNRDFVSLAAISVVSSLIVSTRRLKTISTNAKKAINTIEDDESTDFNNNFKVITDALKTKNDSKVDMTLDMISHVGSTGSAVKLKKARKSGRFNI